MVNIKIPSAIIKEMSTKEGRSAMRKEYTRLRAIAQKRLKRMEKASAKKGAKKDWRKSDSYKKYDGQVPKLKGMAEEHFPYELAKLARWVESPTSSMKEMSKQASKALDTLHKHGYNIAAEDFDDFTNFMEDWREQKLDEIYDSEQTAEIFWKSKEKNRDPAQVLEKFYNWQEQNKMSSAQAMQKVEKMPAVKKKVASQKKKKKSSLSPARKKRWSQIKKSL